MGDGIDEYIRKQPSPQREICLRLRGFILGALPGVREGMKWGVPSFADGKFYIVALKDHVNLGFSLEGLSKEESAIFDGGGKTMKHVRIDSPDDIDEERIMRLLNLVYSRK